MALSSSAHHVTIMTSKKTALLLPLKKCGHTSQWFLHGVILLYGIYTVVLPNKSLHNNRDIFYDEMVLIFFMKTIAKLHVKKLTVVMNIF